MIRIMGKKEKASVGKEASLEIKNQTIIIKEFTKNCYISPIPFAGSQQEHLALCVHVKKSDQSILTQSKKRKERKSLTPSPKPQNCNSRVQIQKKRKWQLKEVMVAIIL